MAVLEKEHPGAYSRFMKRLAAGMTDEDRRTIEWMKSVGLEVPEEIVAGKEAAASG